MRRIATNSLTGWAFMLLIGFWILSLSIPGLWLAVAVRVCLLVGGVAALCVWGPAAFNILRDRRGPDANRGEVLSLMGIATIAAGVTWSSVWGLVWYSYGMPAGWSATGHSMFGHYLLALGLAMVYRSTDVYQDTVRPVNVWLVGMLIVTGAVVGFLLGTRVAETSVSLPWSVVQQHAQCSPALPYWTSSRGVVHGQESPYREMMRPRQCFRTEGAALAAGYRVPRG